MKEMNWRIIEGVAKRGYGCFISDDAIVTIKDGFTDRTSIVNIHDLMGENDSDRPPLSLDNAIDFIVNLHTARKEFDNTVDPIDIKQVKEKMGSLYTEEPLPIMDEFDKTLKMLYESTHDKEIRESLLITQTFKTLYLNTPKS